MKKYVFFCMEQNQEHKHYWLGKNIQNYPDQQIIIKMSAPRVFIRYKMGDEVVKEYEEFYSSIEEIQWMDEKRPTSDDIEAILEEAWIFLKKEETLKM